MMTWPPWPNGQGVGFLIQRLRARVPQGYIIWEFGAYCAGGGMLALRPDCEDACLPSMKQCGPNGMQKAWPLFCEQSHHLSHGRFLGCANLSLDVRLPWVGPRSGHQPDPARAPRPYEEDAIHQRVAQWLACCARNPNVRGLTPCSATPFNFG
jgi:hypothetical protein